MKKEERETGDKREVVETREEREQERSSKEGEEGGRELAHGERGGGELRSRRRRKTGRDSEGKEAGRKRARIPAADCPTFNIHLFLSLLRSEPRGGTCLSPCLESRPSDAAPPVAQGPDGRLWGGGQRLVGGILSVMWAFPIFPIAITLCFCFCCFHDFR